MLKKEIKLKRSPFYKQRNMKAPRGSTNVQTQISQDMLEDFMKYARYYNAEHPPQNKPKDRNNKANPLKHIINEFLNTHALERKCFDDLYIIMAFELKEFTTIFDRNIHHEIIGFVQEREKFTKYNPFKYNTKEHNRTQILYLLEPFNADTLDLLNLKSHNRAVLFDVDQSTQSDFIDPSWYDNFLYVKQSLESMYLLDFDNAFICMFKLNNYLDILQDGVYVSKDSTYSHDGIVVMFDPEDVYMINRICARYTWSYNRDAETFTFDFHVENYSEFNTKTIYHTPRDVFFDYWNTSIPLLSQKSKLEMRLKQSKDRVENLSKKIEQEKQRQNKIIESLDKIKDK